jgi:hypothetical protein
MESEERRGAVTVTQRGWNTGGKMEEDEGTMWIKKRKKENETTFSQRRNLRMH